MRKMAYCRRLDGNLLWVCDSGSSIGRTAIGTWAAFPQVPGVFSQGATLEENLRAIANRAGIGRVDDPPQVSNLPHIQTDPIAERSYVFFDPCLAMMLSLILS